LIGFYGPGGDDDYPKELGNDWPGWYVPIPIHTVAGEEDYIAPGDPQCPRQDELRKLLQKAPEYTKAQAEYKVLLDFLREKTGEKMADPFACWTIGEAFMIEANPHF
jgi:lysosomal acid phosphatase